MTLHSQDGTLADVEPRLSCLCKGIVQYVQALPKSHAFSRALCMSSCASLMRKLENGQRCSKLLQCSRHSLVPPDGRPNCSQMPQRMCVQHAPPRREVEEFQTHSQNDPGHNQTWPSGPDPAHFPKARDREPCPEYVLDHADRDVGGHVVGVVESDEGQVADVRQIEGHADCSPES